MGPKKISMNLKKFFQGLVLKTLLRIPSEIIPQNPTNDPHEIQPEILPKNLQ